MRWIIVGTGFMTGMLLVNAVAAQGPIGGRLCVGADRVLRYAGTSPCPAGQSEYLSAAGGQAPGTDPTAAAQIAELRSKLEFMGKRLADVEQAAAGSKDSPALAGKGLKIRAPFEVVDGADKTIFAVRAEPRGLTLVDAQGRTLVAASALAAGGFVKTLASDGSLQTVIGVNGKFAGLLLRQGDQVRGTFAIAEDGKPILNIANDNFVTVVALTQGAAGGGYLALGNAQGASTVEAGTTSEGVGLVRAFPLGSPGAGLVGMPGTFIIGRGK